MNTRWLVPVVVGAFLAGTPVLAQKVMVYPAKGQTPQQQQKDEGECHVWATQQSGFDPAKPPPPQAAPAGAAPGSGVRSAARGAVVGGAIGGASGGDAGNAAAAGAVVGAMAGRARSRAQQQAAQSSAAAAGPDAYNRARGACLTGRGYSIS